MPSASSASLASVVSVLTVSLVSLLSLAIITIRPANVQGMIFVMVSLAVGAMFGDTFIHLLPEAFRDEGAGPETSLWVLAGLFMFFLLEKFLLWRHEHVPHYGECIRPVGYVNIVAEGLHNFIDGLLIGASYLVSLPVGLGTTIAVLLHEIPQEIGSFGVLLHAGLSKLQALGWHCLSASLAFVGVVLALVVGTQVKQFPLVLLPLTAGGFIYIAGSDLVPELHKERQPKQAAVQFMAIGAGILVMLLLKLLG